MSQALASIISKCSAVGTITVIRKRDINDVLPADLVEQQFPSFIREDYPKMVEFTRAYYDYMAQTENGRIKNLRNIDETSGDYLNHLQNEYLYNAAKPNFEQDFAAEDFIRFSRQFYAAKGTEESIKFLFRAQANREIDIEYPSELIFKPSTAHWYQEQSFKIKMTATSIPATYFIGSYLTVRNKNGEEQTLEISNVIDLTQKTVSTDLSTEFEVFFTTELIIDVGIGAEVFATNFSAVITPSMSAVEIVDPGADFRVGQVVKLDSIAGSGAVAVITKVLDGGKIRNLKLIKFGSSYTTNFYLSIEPEGVFTNTGASFTVPSIAGVTATINKKLTDVTEGFLETQSILKSDYVLNNSPGSTPMYTYPGYDGKYVSQSSNRQVFFLEENYSALLLCKIGAICKYPGKYLDQTGMPSNASVLQDNNYYQDFSYVIKSTLDIENYRDTITALAHPAGFKMFGELSIENEFYSNTTADASTVVIDQVPPSLYLDFISSNTLDSRITFTRASSGTYFDSAGVLQTAAANAPRFDYNPTTLQPLGLLIEEARTNVFLNAGGAFGGAIGTGTSTGPDGALCRSFTPTAGAASFPQFGSTTTAISLTNGQTQDFAFSAYFAAGVIGSGGFAIEPFLVLSFSVSGASPVYATCHINTSAWTIRSTGLDATTTNVLAPTLTLVPSGMYKLTWIVRFTQNATIRNRVTAAIQTREVAATGVFTADGTTNVQYSSVQVELGSSVTSYIPTTTAAATRAADNSLMTGTNFSSWYNQSEGTLVFKGDSSATTGSPVMVRPNDGSYNNLLSIQGDPANTRILTDIYSGGGRIALLVGATAQVSIGSVFNSATAYQVNDFAQSVKGAAVVTDLLGAVPVALNRLAIGYDNVGSGSYINGHVQTISYYPRRLSNAELQSITK